MEDTSSDVPSLRERIEAWSAEHAADFPEEVQRIFARKTEEVLQSGIVDRALGSGDTAPDFSLPGLDGQGVRLGEELERGPVILSFYRGSWCPYCNIEFLALLDTVPRFHSRGAAVLAISPQVNNRRDNPGVAGFADLADAENRVARQFGLVYPLGEEIRSIYRRFGLSLLDYNGDDSHEVPIPATYLVDRDFTIRYAHAHADITERAEPATLLEQVALLG